MALAARRSAPGLRTSSSALGQRVETSLPCRTPGDARWLRGPRLYQLSESLGGRISAPLLGTSLSTRLDRKTRPADPPSTASQSLAPPAPANDHGRDATRPLPAQAHPLSISLRKEAGAVSLSPSPMRGASAPIRRLSQPSPLGLSELRQGLAPLSLAARGGARSSEGMAVRVVTPRTLWLPQPHVNRHKCGVFCDRRGRLCRTPWPNYLVSREASFSQRWSCPRLKPRARTYPLSGCLPVGMMKTLA